MQNARRLFLKLLAASPVLSVACASNSGDAASFGDIAAGNVSGTALGMLSIVSGAPAVLARDADGLYAMTITCTHEGCDVAPSSGGTLFCPCHGSRFDANGGVLAGPAGAPLAHFAVTVDANGNVTVHGTQRVAASVRTAVG